MLLKKTPRLKYCNLIHYLAGIQVSIYERGMLFMCLISYRLQQTNSELMSICKISVMKELQ